ncbi:MAG: TonB-dependent receptor plug [Bacteroidetes bacterium]|nr:TonB-dependent receptor plug [Bacteroidota bacterium]
MKKAALLILMVYATTTFYGQHKSRLFGYVNDADKHPIELAAVSVKGKTVGTITNKNGFYDLELDEKDSVELVVSCVGYKPCSRRIMAGFKLAQLNITLQMEAHELSAIEVKAPRLQTSTSEIIDVSQWRMLPDASGGSIESLIATLPGVHSTNELSSQYSVRGGSYDENSLYVNGIEIYRPLLIRAGQQEGLSFINPDMVQSVSFSAGGFAPKYGDKMSSVLDITYKRPSTFEGSVSIGLLGASAYVGSSSRKFSQMHGLRYKSNSSLLGTLDTKGQYDPSFFDYQTYLTYAINSKLELSFLGNISQNNYRFTPKEQETSFGTLETPLHLRVYFNGKEEDVFKTQTGALAMTYKPQTNLKLKVSASAFNTEEEETYDILGQYWLYELSMSGQGKSEVSNAIGVGSYLQHARNELNATVAGLNHTGEWNVGRHLLEWGINAQRECVSNKMREWEYRDSAGYSLPYTSSLKIYYNLTADLHSESYRSGGYLQDTYKLRTDGGLWAFTGGVRMNYWSFNKERLASPRFTVSFCPRSSNLSLRFATGVYYQTPFYKELRDTTVVGGNAVASLNQKIKSQRSLHFVLGADYHFTQWNRPFKFTAEAYYKPATNVIPYVVDNVKITYFDGNCAKAYSAGLDMKLFGEFVPGTDSWIGLSLMQSRQSIRMGVDNAGRPIYSGYISRPNEQRYSVTMFFQDYVPDNERLKVSLKLIWSDGLPVAASHNPYEVAFRTPDYRRIDIGASYALIDKQHRPQSGFLSHLKSVWLNLDVFNLLDISNVNSYMWLSDIYGRQYAIPNYLTRRQLNVRISADF